MVLVQFAVLQKVEFGGMKRVEYDPVASVLWMQERDFRGLPLMFGSWIAKPIAAFRIKTYKNCPAY